MDRDEREQPGAHATPHEHLLVVQRLGIVRYRGQFGSEPLLLPPAEPVEVADEPEAVGLPDPPPAEEEVAFGSDVEVTGGVAGLSEPSPVPLLVLPLPVELSPPDGRMPLVVDGVVEAVVPGSVVVEPVPVLSPVVPSSPAPTPFPPVVGASFSAAEVSCATALLRFVPRGACLPDEVRGRDAMLAERAAAATAGYVCPLGALLLAPALGDAAALATGVVPTWRT
jgi:hypothetical protein